MSIRLMQIQLRIIKMQPLTLFLSLSTKKNIGDGVGAKNTQTMTLEMKKSENIVCWKVKSRLVVADPAKCALLQYEKSKSYF